MRVAQRVAASELDVGTVGELTAVIDLGADKRNFRHYPSARRSAAFRASPRRRYPASELSLRVEQKKIGNLRVGLRVAYDVHGTRVGHGTVLVALRYRCRGACGCMIMRSALRLALCSFCGSLGARDLCRKLWMFWVPDSHPRQWALTCKRMLCRVASTHVRRASAKKHSRPSDVEKKCDLHLGYLGRVDCRARRGARST